MHNMVGQNKKMQGLLYGVQNPSDKPGLLSKLKGNSGKREVEEKSKWEYESPSNMNAKSVIGK